MSNQSEGKPIKYFLAQAYGKNRRWCVCTSMSNTTNPHHPSWLDTTWEDVTRTTEYTLAQKLIARVQELGSYFSERHRLASLYDQLTRNSQSILHNYCEAFGKGRGFYASALWIARGESFECCGSLSICPKDIRDELLPLAVELTRLISDRIKAAPPKPV